MAKTSSNMREDFYFRHDELPERELHAYKCFCHITQEGAGQDLFGVVPEGDDAVEANITVPNVTTNVDEDVARFLALGLTVDDDNLPIPDNIPAPETDSNEGVAYGNWDEAVVIVIIGSAIQ